MIRSPLIADRIARGDLREGINGPEHARIRLRRLLRHGSLALNEVREAPAEEDVPPPFAPADDPMERR